ncbi:ribonuclease III domain-containing protein [Coleofasciculus sp. H7-2]|uniref:ribonuclease III domain-containing protein n=1 Tax=Coleofasciculus sp. H7-2 TaxID=3351545 RepID=UPI00366FEA02
MTWNPETVENKIGIRFKDKNLLRLALTHNSFATQIGESEQDNQRLEFLGNAILNFVVADYLYERCPYLEVSKFSVLRDKLVDGERLTKLWFQLGLGEELLLGSGEDWNLLRQKVNNPFKDAFEALLGAMYLDRRFSQTQKWLVKHLIDPVLEHHLQNLKERKQPNKQLEFLGNGIINAAVSDYLYRKFPQIRTGILSTLRKQLINSHKLAELKSHLRSEDSILLGRESEKIGSLSFKAILGEVYNYHERSFSDTCNWFKRFIQEDEVLILAIPILLEDGKHKEWIIKKVMGYEGQRYKEGVERFNQLMEPQAS